MGTFIIGYLIFQVVLFVVILLITNRTDKKGKIKYYKPNEVPVGFMKTKESFIDTSTKQVIYVYYNKSTGQRIYVEY
ncbi:hypothetical protein [Salirhabdus sp. Marseille-P4669]|uniref:hypothetical protein n=1 Tax=Salirhabdus sp. Marseille-P4669 TaxID=2042310 RepID=UPI000C7E681A|nr:hypothetical protein [Salirhabdus sp. Marseille-P4669]